MPTHLIWESNNKCFLFRYLPYCTILYCMESLPQLCWHSAFCQLLQDAQEEQTDPDNHLSLLWICRWSISGVIWLDLDSAVEPVRTLRWLTPRRPRSGTSSSSCWSSPCHIFSLTDSCVTFSFKRWSVVWGACTDRSRSRTCPGARNMRSSARTDTRHRARSSTSSRPSQSRGGMNCDVTLEWIISSSRYRSMLCPGTIA